MSTRPLVIFDLNGIFIERRFEKVLPEDIGDAHQLGNFLVWKRPDTAIFLAKVFEVADVAIWSSVNKWNAHQLSTYVFDTYHERLVFIYDQSHCETVVTDNPHKPLFLKNLSRVWEEFPQYNEKNTLIIDDSDQKMVNNPAACHFNPGTWSRTASLDWTDTLQRIVLFAA